MFKTLIQKIFGKSDALPSPTPQIQEVCIPEAVKESKYAPQYEAALNLLRGYPVKGPSVQIIEIPKRGVNNTPQTLVSLSKDLKTYLRKLKVSRTRKELLEARLLAINFVDQSIGIENVWDSFLANLEALIISQRRQGAKVARTVQRKKRK